MEIVDFAHRDYGSCSEIMTTRLPSWGDPILPEVWKISEEEMNEKFPLPGTLLSSLEDHQQDCCILKMPFTSLQNEGIEALWNSKQRKSLDSIEMASVENDGFDNDSDFDTPFEMSSHGERSGGIELRDGLEKDNSESLMDVRDDEDENPCAWTDDEELETMDTEADFENFDAEQEAPKVSWVIEAEYYGQNHILRFRLKTDTGVCMLLFQDEILGSIKAILDDESEEILFEVHPINTDMVIVTSDQVISKVSNIIEAETRKRQVGAWHNLSNGKQMGYRKVRVPSFSIKKKVSGREKCRDRQNRMGFSWRALSGRNKIRPRPLNRVE